MSTDAKRAQWYYQQMESLRMAAITLEEMADEAQDVGMEADVSRNWSAHEAVLSAINRLATSAIAGGYQIHDRYL
jgi:hypothetical protein